MTARITFDTITIRSGLTAQVAVGAQGLPSAFESLELPGVSGWSTPLGALLDKNRPPEHAEALKLSAKNSVWRVHGMLPDGPPTVICRSWSHRHPIVNRIRSWLNFSAPQLHRRKAMRLLDAGIHTAVPLALCQPSSGNHNGWLITTDVAAALDLDTIALNELPRLNRRERFAATSRLGPAIVDSLVRLHRREIRHRDLKASNVLLTEWQHDPKVWIVDVEGVRLFGRKRPWFPLIRLASSLLPYRSVSLTVYARVLRAYLERCGAGEDAWRERLPLLARQAQRYRQSSQRRKRSQHDDGFDGD